MKIVVCVIGQMRASSLTWPSFKKYVLDELGADLVTCGPDANVVCEYTSHAVQNIYSESKVIPGKLNNHIILDHRTNLGLKLEIEKWDQVILTRSDLVWYGPHPTLDLGHIWFMNREFHFGISERHSVMSSKDFPNIINLTSVPYPENCRNMETFLMTRLKETGVWGPKCGLAYFPMYIIDSDGKWRYPDEQTPDVRTHTWPFTIVFNEVSRNGMFCGRVV